MHALWEAAWIHEAFWTLQNLFSRARIERRAAGSQEGKLVSKETMYTIGDFLIQIKNGYMGRKKEITIPYSKAVFSIGEILVKEGYVKKVSTKSEKQEILVELLYKDKNPAINEIKLVSKPSIHHYLGSKQIKKRIPRHGIGILSTNRGIMTSRDAQKNNVGGELICQIF